MSTININLSANTIYSGDGTLAGNRNVDANGYQLQISNAGVFIVDSSFAPSGGNGTFTLNGYGTSGSDLVEKIASDSGVIRESYGNKDQRFYGDTYIQTGKAISFNGSLAYINKSGGSNGLEIFVNGAGHVFGWSNGQQRSTGNLDTNSIEHVNTNVDSYFAQSNGSYQWQYGKTGNDGAIRGNIGVGFVNTELVKLRQTDGAVIFSNSVTKHNGLTTTQKNALTAEVGMIVFDSTLNRYERYDSVFGWVTMAQRTIHVECNTIATLSTGSNFYFANFPLTASTTLANREFLSPYTGKITGAFIRSFANSVAGNRDISVYLVINGTDYLIATVTGSTSTANREFINEAINTTGVSVIKNVTKIAMKVVAGTGTTDSTNILFGGTLIVQ